MDIETLPYRPCVGLMVLNREGKIFAGQRIDSPDGAWQMPQGGIDPGETPEQAAMRELGEETGITAQDAEVLRESTQWHSYDLPRHLVRKLWNGSFRGQTQRWFALRFTGQDSSINIATDIPEFRQWAWMPQDELLGKIVPFKHGTYSLVFDEFADLLK